MRWVPHWIKTNWRKRLFLGSLTIWLFLGFLPGLFQQIVVIIFMYYRDIAGFELAIHKSRFANQICFFVDHFKQFLWNSRIKTFFLLEFLSSGKSQSFFLHFKLDKSLISYSKSVKLYTIFLHLDSILAPNPQWGLTALPHTV